MTGLGLLQLPPVSGILSLTRLPQNPCYSNWGAQRPLTFGETVVYDELNINKRQRKDKEFSSMLDCVRRGCLTDDSFYSSAASHTGVCIGQIQ